MLYPEGRNYCQVMSITLKISVSYSLGYKFGGKALRLPTTLWQSKKKEEKEISIPCY